MSYIRDSIRKEVFTRAKNRCEYCLIQERFSYVSFHIEHIISIKHGGKTDLANLALACSICNLNKGTDIATVIPESTGPIRFFNPRIDKWDDHFTLETTGLISSKNFNRKCYNKNIVA
jgi:HNH endonuclease